MQILDLSGLFNHLVTLELHYFSRFAQVYFLNVFQKGLFSLREISWGVPVALAVDLPAPLPLTFPCSYRNAPNLTTLLGTLFNSKTLR